MGSSLALPSCGRALLRSADAVMGARLNIGFQVWAQFTSWPELMAAGQAIEDAGFDSLWSNDHFLPLVGGPDGVV